MTRREAMHWIDQAKIFGYQRQGIELLAETRAAMSFIRRRPIEDWELKLCDANPKNQAHCIGQNRPAVRLTESKLWGECPVCHGWTYLRQRGSRRGQMVPHVPLEDEIGVSTEEFRG